MEGAVFETDWTTDDMYHAYWNSS